MKRLTLISVFVFTLFLALPSAANDAQFKADSAVADILFEYDGSDQFASYAVRESGFVDITFATDIPDELYSEILARLKAHEDIDGVLAGTSGPACGIF